MREDIEIRRATRRDVEAIQRIEEDSFPSPWRREFFIGELAADGRLNVVVTRDGAVIGYMFGMWIFDEMHVNKIAVTPGERRKGIADALMEHCLAFAREHAIRTITLEVRKSNKGAQEFYKQLGFRSAYTRPRYYPDGESAAVMVLEINDEG